MSHGSPPEQLLNLWQDHHFQLVTSEFQRTELSRALSYEKIRPYVSERQIYRLNQSLDDFAVIVEPVSDVALSSDADDNVILATAIAGKADMLVSGDEKHLIPLGSVEGIPILTPREAIERILSSAQQ